MGWRAFGEPIIGTHATPAEHFYQKITFNSDIVLRAIRTRVIVYGNPTWTALSAALHFQVDGAIGAEWQTSTNSFTRAQVCTLQNGIKEIYFDFSDLGIKSGDILYFRLKFTGYTGTSGSHLAWYKAFPDPIYRAGVPVADMSDVLLAPYHLAVIGATL